MLLPEKQAKGKQCPIIRPAGPCIASGCMGWRWDPSLLDNAPELREAALGEADAARGFCGLAGAVETVTFAMKDAAQ